ncbi:hypothetical protein PRBRB14_16200 [Hallella multisaccharivorax DSM 17128]|nr:hypothetical protein PRBRB14_16200 [Hallella multisaccharivorax DSM 17128]
MSKATKTANKEALNTAMKKETCKTVAARTFMPAMVATKKMTGAVAKTTADIWRLTNNTDACNALRRKYSVA